MAQVTPAMVQELRKLTGVGMAKCKKALDEAGGDIDEAVNVLRKAGIASAVKKEARETNEGLIGIGVADQAVSLLEINAETDFVANNEVFQNYLAEMAQEAASTQVSDIEAFSRQQFSKDSSLTIDEYRAQIIQKVGENLRMRRVATLPKAESTSIGFYSHAGGKIAVAVELEGAGGEEELARDIAMHVAAEAPDYLSPDEIPQEIVDREREIAREQAKGKPDAVIDKIIDGKVRAFAEQACLVKQKFVKDPGVTVEQLVAGRSKETGKPLAIARFLRWQVGE